MLGASGMSQCFVIDTKWPGSLILGSSTRHEVVRRARESVAVLGVKQVDIFYIHTPIEKEQSLHDTLAAINEVYQTGLFRRFGLSNFTVDQVIAVHQHCKEHGYISPSVYQGPYNAFARKAEEDVFPTLRKLGMSFYGYGPIAAGFLTKTKEEMVDLKGRFDQDRWSGQSYRKFYDHPSFLEALSEWEAIAKDVGCSRADLANRWVKYNSSLHSKYGDGFIIGHRTLEQLTNTLKGLEAGPLDAKTAEWIEQVWQSIKHEARTYL